MKAVKLVFAVLLAIYAIAQAFQLIMQVSSADGSAYGTGAIFGAVAGMLLGAAGSAYLFRSALRT